MGLKNDERIKNEIKNFNESKQKIKNSTRTCCMCFSGSETMRAVRSENRRMKAWSKWEVNETTTKNHRNNRKSLCASSL